MRTELLAWLINATFATSLAAVVILLLRRPLQRLLGAEIAYRLWIALPLATIAACFSLPHAAALADSGVQPMLVSAPSVVSRVTSSLGPVAVDRWLLAVWLLGACALLVLLAWQQRRFVARLRLRENGDGSWRSGSADVAPGVLGVLRQKLVLPEYFETDYSDEEQQLVIAHERMHQSRCDPWALATCALLRTLFWFNPLVHVAAGRFRRDIEMACDAAVLRAHPGSRRRYATALLKTHVAEGALPLGCLWHQTPPMKERIILLKHARPARRARLAGAVVVSVSALANAGIAVAGHDAALDTASALAATPTPLVNTGSFYKINLRVEANHATTGSGDTRSHRVQSMTDAIIVRSGETATIESKGHLDGPGWGMSFHVDPMAGSKGVVFTGNVFTNNEHDFIGQVHMAETMGTPIVIAMNDPSSGTAYRINAIITVSAPPPAAPAPPAPPSAPPALADMPAAPAAPALANAPPAPSAPAVTADAPPVPPAPPAHALYARNAMSPLAQLPRVPPTPPVAPLAPLVPVPPSPALPALPPAPPAAPTLKQSSATPPAYPRAALAAQIGGVVRLKLLVGADGMVKRVQVVSSHPAGVFDKASLDAASHWRFNPARNAQGEAIATRVIVPVTFNPQG